MKKISEIIRERLIKNKVSFKSNDNISKYVNEDELSLLKLEVQENVETLLQSLVIDTKNCHNAHDTAKRVSKMYIDELFSGRYKPEPKITSFPNVKKYDQLFITGPIDVKSTCAHHHLPFIGKAWIGIFPGKNVIGLSKYNRVVEHICSRPQIQEECTEQIADAIEKHTKASGVAVVVKAAHFCMQCRGIKANENDFTTSVMRGVLRKNKDLKYEFFNLLSTMKGIKD